MRSKDRQYIPTVPAKPALSLWRRLRSATSVVVAAVRSAGARVVAFVARKATGVRAALSRIARTAMIRRPWILTRDGVRHAAETVHAGNRAVAIRAANWFRFQYKYAPRKVSSWTKLTWHRVIRPFLRVRVAVLGIGTAMIGLVVAPVATFVALAGCGAVLIGLSRLIQHLENSAHPVARVALLVLEVAAQVLRVVAYVAAGVAVFAISAVSAAFAITEVLELVLRYLDVPFAASIAVFAFFVLTASWGLSLMEIAWIALIYDEKVPVRVTKSRSGERQAIPLIRVDAATEEETMIDGDEARTKTAKCMGCDLDDGSARYRVGDMSSLCGECFKCLIDDELITAADRGEVNASDVVTAVEAGISVPAYVVIATGARLRSTRIDLDREAITCRIEARVLSEQDPFRIHWTETGWWFDGRGGRRARRWHGFISGLAVAVVEYEYRKDIRGFYVSISEDTLHRAYKTLAGAQDAAADEVSDRRQAEPQTAARVGALFAGAAL